MKYASHLLHEGIKYLLKRSRLLSWINIWQKKKKVVQLLSQNWMDEKRQLQEVIKVWIILGLNFQRKFPKTYWKMEGRSETSKWVAYSQECTTTRSVFSSFTASPRLRPALSIFMSALSTTSLLNSVSLWLLVDWMLFFFLLYLLSV